MSTQDQIKKAIGAHGLWKTRLAAAIDVGKSEFTVDTVRKDNACDFGRWLYGSELPPAAKNLAEYETCRRLHAEFHQCAAEVLNLAVGGKKSEAQKAMGATGKFASTSASLTTAMMKWLALAEKTGA